MVPNDENAGSYRAIARLRLSLPDRERKVGERLLNPSWPDSRLVAILIGSFLGIHLNRFEPDGKWSRMEIATGTIETLDLDGDGPDEIIAGFRGKPYGVYIYRFHRAKWIREIIDERSVSAASCAAADLDEDGKPEIPCIGQATHNLVLWHIMP
jgi:hypothetical protein